MAESPDIAKLTEQLQEQLTVFRKLVRRPIPDEWPPARVAEVEDLTIELLAALVVTHEAATFLRTAVKVGPFMSEVLELSGVQADDPALQRHLTKKIAAELRSIRLTVERLSRLFEGQSGNG